MFDIQSLHQRALRHSPLTFDLPELQELVAVDERGSREQRALIASYMHHLLPVLLLDQREEQLQQVATCLGTRLAWQCSLPFIVPSVACRHG